MHRIPGGAGPAVAELVAGAHFRRLCRTGAEPAGAVPDPVLVSRRARGVAGATAKRLAVRRGLSQQSRAGHSKADRGGGSGSLRTCHPDRHRRLTGVTQPCTPSTVRQWQTNPDLALRGRPAAWIAVVGSARVWPAALV